MCKYLQHSDHIGRVAQPHHVGGPAVHSAGRDTQSIRDTSAINTLHTALKNSHCALQHINTTSKHSHRQCINTAFKVPPEFFS